MTRARVGLDAHFLARHEGNRTYVRNLLLGWERGGFPPELELVAYSYAPEAARRAFPGAQHRPLPRSPWLRVPFAAPWAQARDGLALWHGTWIAAPWGPAPRVLTIHDVLFATRPELFAPWQGARLRRTVRTSLRRARQVIASSETTRRALLDVYPFLDPQRVRTIPLGIDLGRFRPEPGPADAALAQRLALEGRPYVLCVGRPHPRKNLPAAMGAVAGSEAVLVLAGPLRGAEARLREQAALRGLSPGRLRLLSDPDEAELAALYRGCALLCFPSLAEGVGLPPLEALACGAPVVAYRDPAVAEVCGEAAHLIPLGDEAALAARVKALLREGDPGARERGPRRVARFDLVEMAARTAELYQELLAAP